MITKIKKFILLNILHKNYIRTGKCKGCGQCCSHIYVKHFKHVLKDEKEFKKLQYLHSFYAGLRIIDSDDLGLVFECTHLDPVTKRCKIHFFRPGICRRYPQEELFSMGGTISDDCGFKMQPILTFEETLKKVQKQKKYFNFKNIFSPND